MLTPSRVVARSLKATNNIAQGAGASPKPWVKRVYDPDAEGVEQSSSLDGVFSVAKLIHHNKFSALRNLFIATKHYVAARPRTRPDNSQIENLTFREGTIAS